MTREPPMRILLRCTLVTPAAATPCQRKRPFPSKSERTRYPLRSVVNARGTDEGQGAGSTAPKKRWWWGGGRHGTVVGTLEGGGYPPPPSQCIPGPYSCAHLMWRSGTVRVLCSDAAVAGLVQAVKMVN